MDRLSVPKRDCTRIEVWVPNADLDLFRRFYTQHGALSWVVRQLIRRHVLGLQRHAEAIITEKTPSKELPREPSSA